MSAKRRHVVVDVETTGLELHHQVTEVGWYDLGTDEYGEFFTPHTLEGADPVALEISKYHERIAGKPVDDGTLTREFWARLGGDGVKTTVWGANPGFDTRNLMGLFTRTHMPSAQPWHYRTLDPCQGAYWMFPEGFEFGETPGLKQVADYLGIDLPNHHEAMADVFATVAIIRHLNRIRESVRVSNTTCRA